jgi:hypothetical protein
MDRFTTFFFEKLGNQVQDEAEENQQLLQDVDRETRAKILLVL